LINPFFLLVASNIDAKFLKVVSSAIVDKYIGESARVIREMFGFAREHEPCIIFMDEIDAIGGKRFSEGSSADREIQRTLMELLNQMDGFDVLGKVKIIMATNRPDVLDPALLRPGRLDRKIEIPLPNETSRLEILKIHASKVTKHGEIDYESCAKLAEVRANRAHLFFSHFLFRALTGLICETCAPRQECLRFGRVAATRQTTTFTAACASCSTPRSWSRTRLTRPTFRAQRAEKEIFLFL
jgi:SpoVK/Ycf46/Vps4 family AAA+-type ATPase